MDWFINKEDDIYVDDSSNSLSYDPTFDIENIFNKQNSFGDYEVKIDDFVLEKSEINSNSKLPSPDYKIFEKLNKEGSKENHTDTNTPSISEKNENCKKKRVHIGKTKDSNLSKEQISKHPFIVSHAESNCNLKKLNKSPCENYVRAGKMSMSQINQNSTASIDDAGESLNRSFESNSRENIKESIIEKNIPNKISCSVENYFLNVNDENDTDKINPSEMADCDSLINNNPYTYYDSERSFINGKQLDPRGVINNLNLGNPNLSYYQSLQFLPISDRMKIKREKTKMLLEKKTKRENFGYSGDLNNDLSDIYPNQKDSNYMGDNVTVKNIELNINDEFSPTDSCHNLFGINFNSSKLTKKELKMLRNRISAQRSRDRKKKEMDDLKLISQNLYNENCYLKKEIEMKDREINHIKEKLKFICKNCDNLIKTNKENVSSMCLNNQNAPRRNYSLVDSSRRNFTNTLKYSLMTGFLVVVCLIGTLTWQGISKDDTNILINSNSIVNPGRILNSKSENNYDKENNNNNLADSSTGIILYQNPSNVDINKNYDYNGNESKAEFSPTLKNGKSIFEISKNFDKYKQKYTKSTVSTISNSKENFSVEDEYDDSRSKYLEDEEDDEQNLELNIPLDYEISFLEKKRFEFYLKMQNRKRKITDNSNYVPKRGFLRKDREENKNNICVNTDYMSWSIQEEIDLNEDSENGRYNIIGKQNDTQIEKLSQHKGIIPKSNNPINYNIGGSLLNQVVPVTESRFNDESSVLKESIKSMYCRDFMTSTEDDSEMFKKLFEKLKMRESEENSSGSGKGFGNVKR